MNGRTSQVNRAIDYLLDMMMKKQMIGERGRSYQELESLEHQNMMTRMKQNYINQISRDPIVQRDLSLIFMKTQAGQDASDIIPRLSENIKKRSKAAYTSATNQPWPKEMEEWLDVFTEDALVKLTGFGAAGARQRERIEKIETPKRILEAGRLGVEKRKLGLRKEELELKKSEIGLDTAKGQMDYYKAIHDKKIAPLQSFLTTIISKPEVIVGMELPEDEIKDLLGGAISRENLYKLKKKIDQIDTQAIKRKLTDEEFGLVSDAYDLFAMQAGFEGVAAAEIPPGTPTATNPQTGEKVAYINGQWIKIR